MNRIENKMRMDGLSAADIATFKGEPVTESAAATKKQSPPRPNLTALLSAGAASLTPPKQDVNVVQEQPDNPLMAGLRNLRQFVGGDDEEEEEEDYDDEYYD